MLGRTVTNITSLLLYAPVVSTRSCQYRKSLSRSSGTEVEVLLWEVAGVINRERGSQADLLAPWYGKAGWRSSEQ